VKASPLSKSPNPPELLGGGNSKRAADISSERKKGKRDRSSMSRSAPIGEYFRGKEKEGFPVRGGRGERGGALRSSFCARGKKEGVGLRREEGGPSISSTGREKKN